MDFSSLPFRQPAGLPFLGRVRNRMLINRLLSYPQDSGTRQPLSGTDQAIKRGAKQGKTKEKHLSSWALYTLSAGCSSNKPSDTWSREGWKGWGQHVNTKGAVSCTNTHSKPLLHQDTCLGSEALLTPIRYSACAKKLVNQRIARHFQTSVSHSVLQRCISRAPCCHLAQKDPGCKYTFCDQF